ncbi:hypothetical protein AGIG_G8205 [Arapaima gigas]
MPASPAALKPAKPFSGLGVTRAAACSASPASRTRAGSRSAPLSSEPPQLPVLPHRQASRSLFSDMSSRTSVETTF